LHLEGVWDRGVPNTERIALRPTRPVNLGEYVVGLGVRTPDGATFPLRDDFMWLEEGVLEPPAWVFIYTGPGVRRFTTVMGTTEPALVLHWGRDHTVLNDARVYPVVYHLEGILTPQSEITLGELMQRFRLTGPPSFLPPPSPPAGESGEAQIL